MSAPINIEYNITEMDPVEPIAGEYTVTVNYVLSADAVPGFTSEVETTIKSSALYQNIDEQTMDDEEKTEQLKRNFELLERPAFEAFAKRAKEARDQNLLIEDLNLLTGGVVAFQMDLIQGVVTFD